MRNLFDSWHGNGSKEGYLVIGHDGQAMSYEEFDNSLKEKNPEEKRKIHLKINGRTHLEIAGRVVVGSEQGKAVLQVCKVYSPEVRKSRISLIENSLGVRLQKYGN